MIIHGLNGKDKGRTSIDLGKSEFDIGKKDSAFSPYFIVGGIAALVGIVLVAAGGRGGWAGGAGAAPTQKTEGPVYFKHMSLPTSALERLSRGAVSIKKKNKEEMR